MVSRRAVCAKLRVRSGSISVGLRGPDPECPAATEWATAIWQGRSWPESIQLNRLLPVFIELLQRRLDLLECPCRFLDPVAFAIEIGGGEALFELLQRRLGGGDVGFEVFDLAVGEAAFAFRG